MLKRAVDMVDTLAAPKDVAAALRCPGIESAVVQLLTGDLRPHALILRLPEIWKVRERLSLAPAFLSYWLYETQVPLSQYSKKVRVVRDGERSHLELDDATVLSGPAGRETRDLLDSWLRRMKEILATVDESWSWLQRMTGRNLREEIRKAKVGEWRSFPKPDPGWMFREDSVAGHAMKSFLLGNAEELDWDASVAGFTARSFVEIALKKNDGETATLRVSNARWRLEDTYGFVDRSFVNRTIAIGDLFPNPAPILEAVYSQPLGAWSSQGRDIVGGTRLWNLDFRDLRNRRDEINRLLDAHQCNQAARLKCTDFAVRSPLRALPGFAPIERELPFKT